MIEIQHKVLTVNGKITEDGYNLFVREPGLYNPFIYGLTKENLEDIRNEINKILKK